MITNYLIVIDSYIVNMNYNKFMVVNVYNILIGFDSLLYRPVQICMRRTP